jgi:hypothetical protein
VRGPWLFIARLASAVVVAFALTLFAVGVRTTVTHLRVVCMQTCAAGQVTTAQLLSLHLLGVSLDAYATVVIAVTLLTSLLWFGAAAVVFWRRSDSLFLLLLAAQLVTQGAEYTTGELLGTAWQRPMALLTSLNSIMFCLFLTLFPTGRFAPRWMVWVVVPTCVALAVTALPLPSTPVILGALFPVVLLVLIAAQIYRYRVVSNGIQRQQTKWVILGIGISVLVEIGILVPPALIPGLSAPGALYPLLSTMIVNLALTLGPIAFVIAILRYRLYDIDILINRTLVYGTLTAILAAVYFGGVYGTQALLNALLPAQAAPQSPVIIVASTLLVAALFTPLRRRLQSTIDRRFYRRKYDAARTLAAFGTTLRSEVDLSDLKTHLTHVVDETMQPAHVSLWLRPVAPAERQMRPLSHTEPEG